MSAYAAQRYIFEMWRHKEENLDTTTFSHSDMRVHPEQITL